MPGEHIDKLVKEYTDKMTYTGMTSEQRAKATPEEIELDKTKYGAEIGTQIFKEIESSSLSPEEKQEVYQKLVKAGVQDELDHTQDPATLLRGNTATTRFMSDYMNTYAKEYVDAMYEDTLEAALKAKSQLPDSLVGKKVDSPYGHIEDVTEEDKTKLHKAYGEVAKTSIESSERNLSKLSPEARAFMKAALEPVGTNKEAMNTATASTLLLRCASPMMSANGNLLRDNVETQEVGNLLMGANIALQTYANSMNRSHDNPLPSTKPQNVVSNGLRTKDGMEQTTSAYKAISEGSDSINTFVSKLPPKVGDVGVDLSKEVDNTKRVTEILRRGELKPFEDRIKQLEATQKQLKENPTIGDHIKCFFKHGLKGVQGEIDKIEGRSRLPRWPDKECLKARVSKNSSRNCRA